ncbi:MAG: hypothetical protein QOI99_2416, partial [Actinomycetota bacterium]|nr:hypothetical protein [Actinomycetota bacterium]
FLPLVAVVTMALTACSTSSSSSTTDETTAITGITVPNAYTALAVTPIGGGTFPFAGTDGKFHVAYDLLLLNATALPATLERLDVVDAKDPTKVVATFSGNALVDPTCPYGDCNRLRQVYTQRVQDAAIPIHESRILYVDFTLDSLDTAPKAVLHRLYGTGKATLTGREPAPFNYLTTPLDISAGTARVISPPLKGTNWVALNGCCQPGFPHRDSMLATNGRIGNSQMFAIDWKRANDEGAFYAGDKTKNESYVDYGQPVFAVADGTVVGLLDDVEANAPGVLPVTDPVLAAKLNLENADGNHVILDLGGGVYAMYAHFQKGSITVEMGDKVKKGDKLADLGNTGNANASHLHFQLMDGPNFTAANGLPYEFDNFVYRGQVPLQKVLDADNYVSGTYFDERLATGQPRKDQLPSNLAIVDFPT